MKTILEQQNLIKTSKEAVCDRPSVEKNEQEEEKDEEDEELESGSDNEEIVILEPEPVKKRSDVNLDDEFEKIVPYKFKRLSEESVDEVDKEIVEILTDAAPLEQVLKSHIEPTENSAEAVCEIELASFDNKLSDTVELEIVEANINEASIIEPLPSETIINEALVLNDDQKPPVPIPTYMWEDVKKSKEQVSDNVCTFNLFHAFKVTNKHSTVGPNVA